MRRCFEFALRSECDGRTGDDILRVGIALGDIGAGDDDIMALWEEAAAPVAIGDMVRSIWNAGDWRP